MIFSRRDMIGTAAATLLLQGCRTPMEELSYDDALFGMIGQLKAIPGKRDELARLLIEGSGSMPGNLAYIVAKDAKDADGVWVTEIWKDAASHKASLSLPQVRAAIAKARPIIAGFGVSAEVIPVGGKH